MHELSAVSEVGQIQTLACARKILSPKLDHQDRAGNAVD